MYQAIPICWFITLCYDVLVTITVFKPKLVWKPETIYPPFFPYPKPKLSPFTYIFAGIVLWPSWKRLSGQGTLGIASHLGKEEKPHPTGKWSRKCQVCIPMRNCSTSAEDTVNTFPPRVTHDKLGWDHLSPLQLPPHTCGDGNYLLHFWMFDIHSCGWRSSQPQYHEGAWHWRNWSLFNYDSPPSGDLLASGKPTTL